MVKAPKTLLIVTLTAAAYFVCARLGTFFAVPPGIASAVWPGAGLSFAVSYLFGPLAIPGIFIGAFASALMTANFQFHWFSLVNAGAATGYAAMFWVLQKRAPIEA